jgi:aryl-alcohol dehydrogenase-like predicted oxidoreductase
VTGVLQKRRLGRSGLHVAPFCFGGNVFGWTADRATSFALLDAFTGAGFDFIDTADVYSAWLSGHVGGESETMIGDWLAARGGRARIVIATKVGKWARQPGLKAANIIAACESSLQRLRTDYIDLYQSHADDETVPQDESLAAFGTLIAAGKVRAIGASNFSATRLAAAEKISEEGGLPRYDTLQPLYNLIDRDFERALQPLCVEQEIGVIPFYALAAGFLTGKYRSKSDAEGRARAGTVSKYLTPDNLALLDRMDMLARARGVSLAQIAMAWLRDRPSVVAPIASATSLEQLQALIEGASLVLTADEIAALA